MPGEFVADGVGDEGEQGDPRAGGERVVAHVVEQIDRRGDVDREELGHVRGGEGARDHRGGGVFAHAADRDAGVAVRLRRGRRGSGCFLDGLLDVGTQHEAAGASSGDGLEVDAEPSGEHAHRGSRGMPFGPGGLGGGREVRHRRGFRMPAERRGRRPGFPVRSAAAP